MSRLPLLLALFLPGIALAGVMARDDTGKDVILSRPAQRIVSLAPHLTENLYAAGAGARVVGAVEYSDHPAAAKALPQVGGYDQPNLEAIVKLKPDLVLAWEAGNPPRLVNRLEALGIPVYRSQPERLEDIAREIERLGILAGSQAGAAKTAADFRRRLTDLESRHSRQKKVRLFYQVWNHPLITVGQGHFIDEAMRLCGGENVFAKLRGQAPTVTVEAVLAADPDAIVASGMGRDTPVGLEDWRRWKKMKAVAGDRLYHIPADLMQRATPRLLDGAQLMCGHLEKARGGR